MMSIGGTPTNGGSGSRTNNAVKYASPTVAGLSGEVTVGLGEVPGNSRAARTYGGAAIYKEGPLTAFISYNGVNNAAGTDTAKVTILGAKYDFGVAALRVGASKNKNGFSGSTNVPKPDSTDYIVAVSVPAGPGMFMASYINTNDRTVTNNDAHQGAVGYFYFLSKRTTLYTSYGRIHNTYPNTLTTPPRFYTVGNALDGGTGSRAFDIGIRHIF
jgi:predicted porin